MPLVGNYATTPRKIATEEEIHVNGCDAFLKKFGNVAVDQTYRVLITNRIFIESRGKMYNLQEQLVEEYGCVIPTVQEYVALYVFTKKLFNKCLYSQTRLSFVNSSTFIRESPVVVGVSSPDKLLVRDTNFVHSHIGSGGRKQF